LELHCSGHARGRSTCFLHPLANLDWSFKYHARVRVGKKNTGESLSENHARTAPEKTFDYVRRFGKKPPQRSSRPVRRGATELGEKRHPSTAGETSNILMVAMILLKNLYYYAMT